MSTQSEQHLPSENPFVQFAHLQQVNAGYTLPKFDSQFFDNLTTQRREDQTSEFPQFITDEPPVAPETPGEEVVATHPPESMTQPDDFRAYVAKEVRATTDLGIDEETMERARQDPESALSRKTEQLRENIIRGGYDHLRTPGLEFEPPKDGTAELVEIRTPHDFSLEEVGATIDSALESMMQSDAEARRIAKQKSEEALRKFQAAVDEIHIASGVEQWASEHVAKSAWLRETITTQYDALQGQWDNALKVHDELEQIIANIGMHRGELHRRGVLIGNLTAQLEEDNRKSEVKEQEFNALQRRMQEIQQTVRGSAAMASIRESDAELFRLKDLAPTPEGEETFQRTFTAAVEDPNGTHSAYVRTLIPEVYPVVRASVVAEGRTLGAQIQSTSDKLAEHRMAIPEIEREIKDLLAKKALFVTDVYQPEMALLSKRLYELETLLANARARSTEFTPITAQIESARARAIEAQRKAELKEIESAQPEVIVGETVPSVNEGKSNIGARIPEIDLTEQSHRKGLLGRIMGYLAVGKNN